MSGAFNSFLLEVGIRREHTVRYTPHQNGVAERMKHSNSEGITTLLSRSGLSRIWWEDACTHWVCGKFISPVLMVPLCPTWYIITNLICMRCALSAVSPMYTCRRINALAALGSHTVQCVLVAYPTDYKGRKFWGPANREEIVSDSVVFCESVFLFRRVSLAGVGSLEADPLSFLAYTLPSFLSSPHHPSPCSFCP